MARKKKVKKPLGKTKANKRSRQSSSSAKSTTIREAVDQAQLCEAIVAANALKLRSGLVDLRDTKFEVIELLTSENQFSIARAKQKMTKLAYKAEVSEAAKLDLNELEHLRKIVEEKAKAGRN